MSAPIMRHRDLLDASRSQLLIVDMQEKLVPVVRDSDAVLQRCRVLADAAALFDVPRHVTEQYPKGLGPTVAQLADIESDPPEKLAFSAADAACFGIHESNEPRRQIVVCGIETHVCVLQTALELQSRIWSVAVVADAVASRRGLDHETALTRLRDLGVQIVTTEMVLFEWAEKAGTDEFKQISKLVRSLDSD